MAEAENVEMTKMQRVKGIPVRLRYRPSQIAMQRAVYPDGLRCHLAMAHSAARQASGRAGLHRMYAFTLLVSLITCIARS